MSTRTLRVIPMVLFKLICKVVLPAIVLALFIIYPVIFEKDSLTTKHIPEWVFRIGYAISFSYLYWVIPSVMNDASWFGKLDKTGKLVAYSNPRIHKLAYVLNAIGFGLFTALMTFSAISQLIPLLQNLKLPIALTNGALVITTALIGMRTLGEKKMDTLEKSA